MPETVATKRLVVKVAGEALDAATRSLISECRVVESLHVPSTFTIRFRDPTAALYDQGTFVPGASVDISVGEEGLGDVLTKAEVTRVAMSWDGGPGELEVSGLDQGHRLAYHTVVRTFLATTDSDIATTIAQEHGLTPDVDRTTVTYDYLAQTTDCWAFLAERALAVGFAWWVDDGTLYFKAAPSSATGPTLTRGKELLRFRVRQSAVMPTQAQTVRGWSPDDQTAIAGTGQADDLPPFLAGTTAAARDAFTSAAASATGFSLGNGFTGAHPVATADEANTMAASLATLHAAEQLRVWGEALGNPAIKAGTTVTLKGLGSSLSGAYTPASVEHVVRPGAGYLVRFKAGGADDGSLVDLLQRDAPADWASRGLVPAIVTNTNDEDKVGRIKVKFPTRSDTDESAWARVLAVGAGPARGLQVPYEVNDEVYVAFEHGDVRRPLVVGSAWSKQLAPATTSDQLYADGKGQLTVWQTRTGHRVELHDSATKSESAVNIVLSDGQTSLRLGLDQVTLHSPNPVSVSSDKGITVAATEDLVLQGQNVTVQATANLDLKGQQVTANGTEKVGSAGAQVEASATTTMKLAGSAELEVSGGMVKIN